MTEFSVTMRLRPCEKGDPSKWDDAIVRSVLTRLVGVGEDPACGCMTFMETHDTPKSDIARVYTSNLLANSPPTDGSAIDAPPRPKLCRTCERLAAYEHEVKEKLGSDLAKYGTPDDAAFSRSSLTVQGVAAPASLQRRLSSEESFSKPSERLRGFAALAPPIGVGPEALRDIDQLIFNSAARLHFALTSIKSSLDKRLTRVLGLQGNIAIKDHSRDAELWYLSHSELEHMFIMSGVNWMTRAQLKQTFDLLDLNGSGKLHMSEIADVVRETSDDCLDILKNRVKPYDVRKFLLRMQWEPVGGSLRQQLRSQFQTDSYQILRCKYVHGKSLICDNSGWNACTSRRRPRRDSLPGNFFWS